jgi:hypothetical protein
VVIVLLVDHYLILDDSNSLLAVLELEGDTVLFHSSYVDVLLGYKGPLVAKLAVEHKRSTGLPWKWIVDLRTENTDQV